MNSNSNKTTFPLTGGIMTLMISKYKDDHKEHISENELYEILKCNTKDIGYKDPGNKYKK